ncbi:MAG: hypothetical protein GOMPHAMPRED_004975 [Gomphillus americanus]|uniref:Beta-lactamase-related domain-containing protein n=1 Tax=Gomphillus americanus TaxID=1940652 RepID=A0A8H3I6R0_9LECA|nr:MAG: hypothetical protein GOMPHAMPRED_004975 [Gomphillus americanus]
MANMHLDWFETLLARYTAAETREVLGAIGLVVDREGIVRYHHAGGLQSLAKDAQVLDKEAVLELGSAGKLWTHIAALQLVDRGLIRLDEPVSKYLPELESPQIVIRDASSTTDGKGKLVLQESIKVITLQHLLTHTSGIGSPSDPLLKQWHTQNSTLSEKKPESTPVLLLFTPGEGWNYGPSINWTGKLIVEVTEQILPDYIDRHILKPLGMDSSTFSPLDDSTSRPDLRERRLQMVAREAGSDGSTTQLHIAKRAPPMSPATTASDYGKLLTALMSASSVQANILSKDSIDLLFSGQLSGKALSDFRADTETYAAPTGLHANVTNPKVNFTAAGALLVEEEIPLSGFPSQTLTWNGMPNVIWSVNREIGKAAVFATQLLPVDDEVAIELAMGFLKGAWSG